MYDPYQIAQARSWGADCILLILASLEDAQAAELEAAAFEWGMDVLLEVHDAAELERALNLKSNLVGVNNRNLKTFEVSTEVSKELSKQIPNDFVKVSESGISHTDTIKELKNFGYQGFLIGENFMKTNDPGSAASYFVKDLMT